MVASIVLFASPLACDFGEKQLGEESTTGESESGESESGESGETLNQLVCADITNQADCDAAGNDEIVCDWTMINRAVRTGDSCEVTQVGYCMQDELFGETAAGCGVTPGCEDGPGVNPSYKLTPEGVLLIDSCGGTSEPGFIFCESGEASSDPPECACACALAP
ncbi:hypothetical protein ACNOYE_18765 [Nannocystaceae bacterium ST9]